MRFQPPSDPSVWNNLIADNEVLGFGDVSNEYYRGRRHFVRGDGLGSILGSLWTLVRPALYDIGTQTLANIGKEAVTTVGKRLKPDIFDNETPKKARRTSATTVSGGNDYKKATKTKKNKANKEAWPPKF